MNLPLASARGRTAPAPRPYQLVARERVEAAWAEGGNPLLVMATGTGKTVTGLLVAEQIRGRVVWLAHRQELLDQPLGALWYGQREAGIVQAGRDAADARIVFASVQTLDSDERLQGVLAHGYPELLVVDEAHHSVSPSHRRVIDALRGPGTRLLGLTATADREDDRDLGELWTVAYSLGIVEAIDGGYLLPPYAAVVRCPGLDLSKVSGRRDYDDAELGEALLAAHIVEHTVAVMDQAHVAARLPQRDEQRSLTARGRSCLVVTATVEQARLTAEALTAAGWRARAVSGDTPRDERARLLKAFQRGDIDVLCNAAVLTEGTDLPRCDCVVLARPTRSWSLFCQILGRGLRLWEGQRECLVLDLAGATEDHSLVSAPALIGGSRCPGADNGRHDFAAAKEGKAVCRNEGCSARLPCWAALEAGRDGQHEWCPDDEPIRKCSHCGRPQCQDAPDGRHVWLPAPQFKRACMYCEAEISTPLASMQAERDRIAAEPAPPAAWLRLRQVDPELEVLDLGEHGWLYLVPGGSGLVKPSWLPPRARLPRPLTDGPVERWYAEGIAADLTRKARKAYDAFRRESLFGGQPGASDVVESRRRAAGRAVAVGLAVWR